MYMYFVTKKYYICNMIGIYKITSPSGKVYIGQSVNVKRRITYYKLGKCTDQVRLYSSFKKHGVENHVFEIICECLVSELNDKERYYQDLFEVLSKKGLNCKLTKSSDRTGYCSDVTKAKMSRKPSEETRAKLRKASENRIFTEETRKRISDSNKNKVRNEEQRSNHSKRISKLVLCNQTGIFYDSAQEAAPVYGHNYSTLKCRLQGKLKNNTTLIYA